MSDTDPVVPSADDDITVEDEPTLSTTSLDAGVLYPETDAVRAALSGRPAGVTDEMPPGTAEVEAMIDEQAARLDPDYEPPVDGDPNAPVDDGGDTPVEPPAPAPEPEPVP